MAIDAERWQRIESMYHAALGRVPEERSRFVAEACAGDENLCHEIESLLVQNSDATGSLDEPAFAAFATLFEHAALSPLPSGTRLGEFTIDSFWGRAEWEWSTKPKMPS